MKTMKPDMRLLAALLAVMCCMAAFYMPAFAESNDYFASDETGLATVPDAIESISIDRETVEILSGLVQDYASSINVELDDDQLLQFLQENAVELDEDQFLALFQALFSGAWTTEGPGAADWFSGWFTDEDSSFTPDGNLSLVDDFIQDETEYDVSDRLERKDKQFITVQTKAGNYFYIIIDRSGDSENVYFLNMVDDSDLFALLEDEEAAPESTPVVCTCEDKCEVGCVNTDCPVCSVDLNACIGKEPEVEEPQPEPTMEEPEEPVEEDHETGGKTSSKKGLLMIVLAVMIAAGAAFYFLKVRGKAVDTSGPDDLDDYYDDYDDELDEEDDDTEEDTE